MTAIAEGRLQTPGLEQGDLEACLCQGCLQPWRQQPAVITDNEKQPSEASGSAVPFCVSGTLLPAPSTIQVGTRFLDRLRLLPTLEPVEATTVHPERSSGHERGI